MDANSRKIMGLISEMNMRFVVPVYQRPYSWGESQCVQLSFKRTFSHIALHQSLIFKS